ncbi:MAG: hypothetical protein HY654_13515, partial [Acidobacteria bacterium]|nr:hypothetical protein [Acidobacteriota bacterium]
MRHTLRAGRVLVIALVLGAASASTQAPPQKTTPVTSPKEQFGHEIGADYVLPNYTQLTAYWQKLDKESDRMVLQSIGKTA